MGVMIGEFEEIKSGFPVDKNKLPARDLRLRLNAPDIGSDVVYWEVRTDDGAKPYRQRILAFSSADDGAIVQQQTWAMKTEWPESIDADTFKQLSYDDLEQQISGNCSNSWRRGASGWISSVDPKKCRIWSERRQAWRRIESETIISKSSLRRAERGFDDDGVQVWGTPPGEYLEMHRVVGD